MFNDGYGSFIVSVRCTILVLSNVYQSFRKCDTGNSSRGNEILPVGCWWLAGVLSHLFGCVTVPSGLDQDVKVMGSFDGWTYGEQMSPESTGAYTRFQTVLKLRPGR